MSLDYSRYVGGYTVGEIAEYFGCHYSAVSRVIAKYKTFFDSPHCLF
jgi:NADH:ubiquinone oxidoreductase subunit E